MRQGARGRHYNTQKKVGTLVKTHKNTRWWDSSSGDMDNAEYPFLAINHRSTLTRSGNTCEVSFGLVGFYGILVSTIVGCIMPNPFYFDIVVGMQQGDTLAPYLFIICLDYKLRTSIDIIKDNGFKLAMERNRRYPTQTITDADYADDIALLANTTARAESLLHSLEWAVAGIGFHVNADKKEYTSFNQRCNISTLIGSSLKLVDEFTYQGSCILSTKKEINTWLA